MFFELPIILKDDAKQEVATMYILFTLVLLNAPWNDDKFWNIEVLARWYVTGMVQKMQEWESLYKHIHLQWWT